MDNYIYLVVETEKQEYQEAKPGRNLFFDFEDGGHYYFSSAKNVETFIYGMSKYRDHILTHETNTAYEFCQTYGKKYPSDQLFRELEEDGGAIGSPCRRITTQRRKRNLNLILCFAMI